MNSPIVNSSKAWQALRFAPLVTFLLALIPIWSSPYLPFGDYPTHLARTYVIYHYHEVPLFQQCYELLKEPIPNVAEEVIMPLLMHVVSVHVAGKLFITLSIALFMLGVHLLARERDVNGHWVDLLAPFLYFSNQLFWGTLNYLFGVALFFITFALWYRWRKRLSPTRWVMLVILAPLVYLAHLSAFAFLGLACGAVTVLDLWKARSIQRNTILSLIPLIPPLVLYALFMRGSGAMGTIVWASMQEKVVAVVPFFVHILGVDVEMVLLAVAVIWLTCCYRRQISIDREFLLVAGLLFLGFLLCPRALYTSFGADVRFLLPAWLFLMLSIKWEFRTNVSITLLAFSLLFFITRGIALADEWRGESREIAGQVALFQELQPHSKVLPLYDFRTYANDRSSRPLQFAANYATVTRECFTPSLVAKRGQQPLVLRDTTLAREPIRDPHDSALDWAAIVKGYDYIWFWGALQDYPTQLKPLSTEVTTSGRGQLWKVGRASRNTMENPLP